MSPQVLQNIYTLPIASLQQQLGAYLLGLAISSPIYAISLCQVVLYFRTYRLDPRFLKSIVLILIAMESVRFAFLAHTVYMSFVTLNDVLHHVDRSATCHENRVRQIMLMMVEFLEASLCFVVQSAYVVRIWRLSSRNKILAGAIVIPMLCQFGSGLVVISGLIFETTGQGLGLCAFGGPFQTGQTSAVLSVIYEVSRYSQLCASLVSDAMITLSMFYYLKCGLVETNFFGTKSIISLLISYTLAIGLVTSIFSITALAIFTAGATQVHFPTIHFMIYNVYVNSFLASLNWRMGLREAGQDRGNLGI
ncbi:DUF6534 domain-containing protein [Pleurotus pulmonarius]